MNAIIMENKNLNIKNIKVRSKDMEERWKGLHYIKEMKIKILNFCKSRGYLYFCGIKDFI